MPGFEFEIGANAAIEMGSAAAPTTLVDKSKLFKSFKSTEQVGNEEITTFQPEQFAKAFGYLLNEQDFNADCLYDKPTGAFWRFLGDIIRGRVKVNMAVYPNGKVVGGEVWTFTVLVLNRDRSFAVGEFDKGTIALKRTGPIVEAVYNG